MEIEPEIDTNSAIDVPAAIAVAVTVVGDRPNTGDASSRERERERDVGAETEVEVDTGASRLGARRRGAPVAASASASHMITDDMAEDVDAEMEDVVALPPLPESNSMLDVEQVFADGMDVRENSASPVSGDVEVEGGSSDGSGHAGDAGLHGKRKR